MTNHKVLFVIALSFAPACASRQNRDSAMTAVQHEQAADAEAARSTQALQRARAACPGYGSQDACYRYWTSFRNPTQQQFVEARKHRELAEKHRAASQAIRDAEARACVGIPAAERDISPFLHVEDVASVEPLEVERKGDVLNGVRVVFRPLPGMTADWLQRVVDCHLARNAVIGYADATRDSCPLQVRNVTAVVHPVDTGLAIDIRPETPRASRGIHLRMAAAATYCASRR